MASDLAATPQSGIHAQLCGDAHLANFGGFASPERELIFDINDFDETAPGPWEWDVKRLAASFEIAGRERGFTSKERHLLVLAVLSAYHQAMNEFAAMPMLAVWYSLLNVSEVIKRLGPNVDVKAIKQLEESAARAQTRDNVRAFEKLTRRVDGRLQIVSHPPLVVPIEELVTDSSLLADLSETMQNGIRLYRQSLPHHSRHLLEQYHYVHFARKVVGVGSVGTRTWIILMEGSNDQDHLFLQMKEAQPSVLEPYAGKSVFEHSGERVVEGQKLIQAATDTFLGWERVPGVIDGVPRDVYVRQLWDWKISANIETMSPQFMKYYAEICGWALARAHARTGDRVAISAYLGKSDQFDQAVAQFAVAYADQNERDYRSLVDAVNSGRIKAETGV